MNASSRQLATLIIVFFFWGFVAASNGILIPLFKAKFELSQFQSQLVDWAFYAAYFVGAGIYFIISHYKGDPLNDIGYKKGLIYGLLMSAVGALGFIAAAKAHSYGFLLSSLFIIGLGFALQQIVANPYVIAVGKPETGSHRLNLAGGINSFGTTIGPVLLSYALFGGISGASPVDASIDGVILPALILCGLFIMMALVLGFSNLPPITNQEKLEKDLGALKYPQLTLGMLAIFVYVGVEVTIGSNLGALLALPEIKGLDHSRISHFVSLYWGSLMIGRWTGAITVFNLKKTTKQILTTVIPLLAFGVIYGVNYLRGSDVEDYLYYLPFLGLGIVSFYLAQEKPARTLMLFGLLAAIMMVVGLMSTGDLALYSFISGGLFCSVMWPCIFSLAISGLGKYTNQGSSLLIMMILGGAIIPPFQGFLGDSIGVHASYIVAVVCFLYLAFYGYRIRGILKSQGIDYDGTAGLSH